MGATTIPAQTVGTTGDKWVLISSVTASGTSVNFTSISGYRKLALLWKTVTASSSATPAMSINSDTTSNYYLSWQQNDTYNKVKQTLTTSVISDSSSETMGSGLLIIDSADQTGFKPILGTIGLGVLQFQPGTYYLTSSAVTSVQFTTVEGTPTLSVGTVALYGVAA